MIIFVPSYDPATRANLAIASQLSMINCMILLKEEAQPAALVASLSQLDVPLFVMSHGQRDALLGDSNQAAISSNNVYLVRQRTVFAFACHTATHLGKLASQHGANWWGYTGAICAPDESEVLLPIFTQVFIQIQIMLSTSTVYLPERIIEKIYDVCMDATEAADRVTAFIPSNAIFEVYRCLFHLWNRLRIWTPNCKDPYRHPKSSGPLLLD